MKQECELCNRTPSKCDCDMFNFLDWIWKTKGSDLR